MHTWSLTAKDAIKDLNSWVDCLKLYNIYYSNPLDLDFLMLTHYSEFYKNAIPENGGPQIPDKIKKTEKFQEKINTAIHATLKSEEATAATYSEDEKELMIWYNYHFLGRGKPATHIQVLSFINNRNIKKSLPPIFTEIFNRISLLLK